MMALLEVKGLVKYFDLSGGVVSQLFAGKKILKAVDHVSFTVEEGKTFGLVGESGCGKSTTARLIARLIPANAGAVKFDGRDILQLPRRELREMRKHIQMVFQDPFASLNPRMKVIDIVGRPLTLYYGVNGRERADHVAELLEKVGLQTDHLQRYPHEFSGGQRQRIGIARALAAGPRLIIADEPVSALDVSVQAQVLNLLKQIQRDLNLTLLFISHDLNVVGYMADVIGVMYAGKLVEVADAREIFSDPLHPYTKGLLASNPTVSAVPEQMRSQLKGEIAFPINPPAGCRLEPRCPIRKDKCKAVEPLLEDKGKQHWAACHDV